MEWFKKISVSNYCRFSRCHSRLLLSYPLAFFKTLFVLICGALEHLQDTMLRKKYLNK